MRSLNDHLDHFYQREKETRLSEESLQQTVAGLSHSIRTPLTSLDGYLQLLETTENDEDKEKYISILKMRVSSLNQILNQLFTYVKLQQEAYALELSPVDLKEILAHSLFSYYEDFSAKGFEVKVSLPDELPLVNANAEALERVVHNLIKNALDHGEKTISISLEEHDAAVTLLCMNQVSEGVKIREEDIFRQFYKASASRSGSSTGLGLFIAKGLVSKMQGTMEAQVEDNWFKIIMTLPKEVS